MDILAPSNVDRNALQVANDVKHTCDVSHVRGTARREPVEIMLRCQLRSIAVEIVFPDQVESVLSISLMARIELLFTRAHLAST